MLDRISLDTPLVELRSSRRPNHKLPHSLNDQHQRTSPRELMRLPSNISRIDELPTRVCEEARSLVGFWSNCGIQKPAISRSNWARRPRLAAFYWSETIKLRLARQVDRIRRWMIIEGSWEQAPDINAHWFIDPPYNNGGGQAYRYHDVDYKKLAKWSKRRRGFVQVCAHEGATYLPFEPVTIVSTPRGYSTEVVYEIEN
jgi:hypothetical protein